MSSKDSNLKEKYFLMERYIYDPNLRYPGLFIIPGVVGLLLTPILGLPLLIIDLFKGTSKPLTLAFIASVIIMCLIAYFVIIRKSSEKNSPSSAFYRPAIVMGMSGLFSSLFFLYMIYEMFYWTIGPGDNVNVFMGVAFLVYLIIIAVQYIWVFIALKKGYYRADNKSKELNILRKKMNKFAGLMILPVLIAYASLAPFAYSMTRVLVHTVEDYPTTVFVIMTLLLILPFGLALSAPVVPWVIIVKKYKKFIPEKTENEITNNKARKKSK
jgi:hypothetical protein